MGKPINKGRRKELGLLKYKKRLKNLRLKEEDGCNYNCYRTTGKPCSCPMCSPRKQNDKPPFKDLKKINNDELSE